MCIRRSMGKQQILMRLSQSENGNGDFAFVTVMFTIGSKQAVSKWATDLRDQTGIALTVGKKSSMRQRYREAQIAAINRGTHASFKREEASSKNAQQLS